MDSPPFFVPFFSIVKVFMGYYLLYIGCNGKKNPETSKYFAIFYYLCGRKVRNEAVT